MRLIDADELIKEFDGKRFSIESWKVKEMIDSAPTLPNPCGNPCNFTRPTGKWIEEDNDFLCSRCNCGTHQPTLMGTPMFAFCPICGAKMKGE